MSATRNSDCTKTAAFLYLSLELGNGKWELAFTVGLGRKPRRRKVEAGDFVSVTKEIRDAKGKFDLPEDTHVVSCYEAGRDGFWLHRFLGEQGVENLVVDSSSILIDRRKRRAKTDRLDGVQLLRVLIRWHLGERDVCSVVNVPSEEEEDSRQLHRELECLRKEQTAHSNRIKGLLATCGVPTEVKRRFPTVLRKLRMYNGNPVPAELQKRLLREFERMQQTNRQIRELERERAQRMREEDDNPNVQKARQLMGAKAIGANSAWLFVHEVFGWRKIRNRRELASLLGLTPTPYNSGTQERDQGISKAGNRRMRAMSIEIAWIWLRYQPQSELSRWYRRRFGHGGKRLRKIGIVALARKLVIALWRYLETGVPPAGAELGDWRTKFQYTTSL